MSELTKEQFFNLIELLTSPDVEIRELGKLIGWSYGLIIHGGVNNYSFSFEYKNSYWYVNPSSVNCCIPSLDVDYHTVSDYDYVWKRIE